MNLNYVFSEPDQKDFAFKATFGATAIDPKYLPKTVDLRPSFGEVYNQMDIGSCVSNTVAGAIRYCFKKEGNKIVYNPSRLFVYYNGRVLGNYPSDKDTGISIRDGYKSVDKFSACKEDLWPYVTYKYSQKPPPIAYAQADLFQNFQYLSLESDINQFKKCLKDGFPISFGAMLYQSFMSSSTKKTGIIPVPNLSKESRAGGHAMLIVGYDDTKEAFIIANSWGSSWGINGFAFFPYAYMMNTTLCSDFWSPRLFS